MSAQSLRETLTSALDFIQSGEQMGPGASNRGHLARVGQCLCGVSLSEHFDARNNFIPCAHLKRVGA